MAHAKIHVSSQSSVNRKPRLLQVEARTRESDRFGGSCLDGSDAAGAESRGAARTITAADFVSRSWPWTQRLTNISI